jgi:hypothetical protein
MNPSRRHNPEKWLIALKQHGFSPTFTSRRKARRSRLFRKTTADAETACQGAKFAAFLAKRLHLTCRPQPELK